MLQQAFNALKPQSHESKPLLSADQLKSAVAPQISRLERSGRMEKMSAALKMSEHLRFIAAD